jgi:hypothetical protein
MTATGIILFEFRDDFWFADTFAASPYMSPYLVAFAVIDYPHLETVSNNGHLVRSLHVPVARFVSDARRNADQSLGSSRYDACS